MKKIINSPLLPFFALTFIYFILHLILPVVGDDTFSIKQSVEDPLKHIASSWKTFDRILSDSASFFFLKKRFLFAVFSACLTPFMGWALNYLLGAKNRQSAIFCVLLIFIYPFWDQATAGYVSTETQYLWVLCFVVFALLPIKKAFEGENLRFHEYLFYALSIIYAATTELGGLILVLFYGSFAVFAIRAKKTHPFIFIGFSIALLEFLFVLKRPGLTVNRQAFDVGLWFPDFMYMSLFNRAELAISSALYHFFFKPNAPFLIFYVLLIATLWQKFQDKRLRLLALFPGFIVLIFGYLLPFARDNMTLYGYISPYSTSIFQYLLLGLLILLMIMIAAFVALAFPSEEGSFCLSKTGKKGVVSRMEDESKHSNAPFIEGGDKEQEKSKCETENSVKQISYFLTSISSPKSILCLLILSIGFISRMPMMFAPSIWGSQTRTFTFANFALLASAFMLWRELKNTDFNGWKALNIFIYTLAAINLILIFLYVLYQGGHLPQGLSEMIAALIKYYDLLGWEMAVLSIGR